MNHSQRQLAMEGRSNRVDFIMLREDIADRESMMDSDSMDGYTRPSEADGYDADDDAESVS